MDQLYARFDQLGLHIHSIEERMPAVVVGPVLTPSDASRKPGNAKILLECLELGASATPLPDTYTRPPDLWPNLSFAWPKESPEKCSYLAVMEYLRDVLPNRPSYNVANGQNLFDGNLFDQDVYSLRQYRSQHGGVVHKLRIHGRTDLVMFHENSPPLVGNRILRHQVDVCIEIKRPQDMSKSSTGCEMEAMMQLIGMNIGNSSCSPVVVLSDLKKHHCVYQLNLKSADEKDVYYITKQLCADFGSAIHRATQHRGTISINFSRPPTPEQDEVCLHPRELDGVCSPHSSSDSSDNEHAQAP